MLFLYFTLVFTTALSRVLLGENVTLSMTSGPSEEEKQEALMLDAYKNRESKERHLPQHYSNRTNSPLDIPTPRRLHCLALSRQGVAWKNGLTHVLSLEALPFHMIGLLCFVGSEIATVLSDHSRGSFFHWPFPQSFE